MKKVIFEGFTKKNRKIIIRYPQKGDTKRMWRYINTLSKEKTYILFQGEKITLKEEKKYFKDLLIKIKGKKTLQLLVYFGKKLVGVSDIEMYDKASSHEGVLGLTIKKEFRNEGIGKILIETILIEAKKQLPKLRIITLGVFSTNLIAKKLYESFGFKEYGILPKGLLYKGKFVDHIYMYKNV